MTCPLEKRNDKNTVWYRLAWQEKYKYQFQRMGWIINSLPQSKKNSLIFCYNGIQIQASFALEAISDWKMEGFVAE